MEKLYVQEIRRDGGVSTVGLFYSRAEAEGIVAQLRSLPDKRSCRYEIAETVPALPATNARKRTERS